MQALRVPDTRQVSCTAYIQRMSRRHSKMRLCGLGVEMPGRWPDGKCQRHQRQKSAEISRCLRPETLPFVCQVLETDGARWDFASARNLYKRRPKIHYANSSESSPRSASYIRGGKDVPEARVCRVRGLCAFYYVKEKREEHASTGCCDNYFSEHRTRKTTAERR
jgi:hypothetical protein